MRLGDRDATRRQRRPSGLHFLLRRAGGAERRGASVLDHDGNQILPISHDVQQEVAGAGRWLGRHVRAGRDRVEDRDSPDQVEVSVASAPQAGHCAQDRRGAKDRTDPEEDQSLAWEVTGSGDNFCAAAEFDGVSVIWASDYTAGECTG